MRDIPIYSDTGGKRKKRRRKIFLLISFIPIFLILSYGAFFAWKIHRVSKNISIGNQESKTFLDNIGSVVSSAITSRHKPLRGEEEGRINILLLGAAGENWPGENLTDTIIIMSVDTKNKKAAILSIPRDLYVEVPQTNYSTKINTLYQYGLNNDNGPEIIKKAVEEITGLPVHYFLIMDFDGFKKIIDDISGVNIMVERDIYDSRYPGPNYSYETFEIKKGLRHLDGETALKYARERHGDPEGDFGRARRQQAVIQAVKNRVFSLQTFLNPVALNNLLNTLGDHIKTNISLDEIESFIALSKKVDTQNITTVVVDAWNKDSLLKVSHLYFNGVRAFILIPRVGNWSEVQDLAQNVFNLDVIKKRQAEIEKEKAKIAIINQSEDKNLAVKIRNLLKDKLNMRDVSVVFYRVKPYRNDTVVIDNTGSKKLFTLDEILKKLPARLDGGSDDIMKESGNYDFVVLLGSDLEKIYSFEEDSMEEFNKARDNQENFDLIKN